MNIRRHPNERTDISIRIAYLFNHFEDGRFLKEIIILLRLFFFLSIHFDRCCRCGRRRHSHLRRFILSISAIGLRCVAVCRCVFVIVVIVVAIIVVLNIFRVQVN